MVLASTPPQYDICKVPAQILLLEIGIKMLPQDALFVRPESNRQKCNEAGARYGYCIAVQAKQPNATRLYIRIKTEPLFYTHTDKLEVNCTA